MTCLKIGVPEKVPWITWSSGVAEYTHFPIVLKSQVQKLGEEERNPVGLEGLFFDGMREGFNRN